MKIRFLKTISLSIIFTLTSCVSIPQWYDSPIPVKVDLNEPSAKNAATSQTHK